MNRDVAAYLRALLDDERSTLPRFSLASAVRQAADGGIRPNSPEGIALREHAERIDKPFTPTSFHVPLAWLQRDLTAAGGGWPLVGVSNAPARDILREVSLLGRLGAEVIPASGGPVTIPYITTATASAQWLSDEYDALSAADPVVSQCTLAAKLAAGLIKLSHGMLKQSNADQLVTRHLFGVLGRLVDLAIVRGSGSSGEPAGIVNTAGVGSFAIDGTATHADALNAVAARRAVDADVNAWLMHPTDVATLSAREAAAGSGFVLAAGRLADVPVIATTAVAQGTAVLGDFRRLVVAQWGDLQLSFDPFTSFNTGVVACRAMLSVDVACVPPAAFAVGTVA